MNNKHSNSFSCERCENHQKGVKNFYLYPIMNNKHVNSYSCENHQKGVKHHFNWRILSVKCDWKVMINIGTLSVNMLSVLNLSDSLFFAINHTYS